MMTRLAQAGAVALLAFSMSGCTFRYITDIQDSVTPADGGNASQILQTWEELWIIGPWSIRTVFYECADKDGALKCMKKCDVDDETGNYVACPVIAGFPL